jgi:hypothetical protein
MRTECDQRDYSLSEINLQTFKGLSLFQHREILRACPEMSACHGDSEPISITGVSAGTPFTRPHEPAGVSASAFRMHALR